MAAATLAAGGEHKARVLLGAHVRRLGRLEECRAAIAANGRELGIGQRGGWVWTCPRGNTFGDLKKNDAHELRYSSKSRSAFRFAGVFVGVRRSLRSENVQGAI